MPKYRVRTKSFINHTIVEEGAIVNYDGIPGPNLEPIDTGAKKAATVAPEANAESLKRQQEAAKGVDLNAGATSPPSGTSENPPSSGDGESMV